MDIRSWKFNFNMLNEWSEARTLNSQIVENKWLGGVHVEILNTALSTESYECNVWNMSVMSVTMMGCMYLIMTFECGLQFIFYYIWYCLWNNFKIFSYSGDVFVKGNLEEKLCLRYWNRYFYIYCEEFLTHHLMMIYK